MILFLKFQELFFKISLKDSGKFIFRVFYAYFWKICIFFIKCWLKMLFNTRKTRNFILFCQNSFILLYFHSKYKNYSFLFFIFLNFYKFFEKSRFLKHKKSVFFKWYSWFLIASKYKFIKFIRVFCVWKYIKWQLLNVIITFFLVMFL